MMNLDSHLIKKTFSLGRHRHTKPQESMSSVLSTPTNSGYVHDEKGQFAHNFTWWSLIGMSFSLTNSWLGVCSSFVVGLSGSGPPVVIYGLLVAFVFTLMCGYCLSEFSYMMPNSGGTGFWTLKLLAEIKPEKHMEAVSITATTAQPEPDFDSSSGSETKSKGNELVKINTVSSERNHSHVQLSISIAVGLINYFGCVFTTASIVSALVYSIIGIHSLLYPMFVLERWHSFVLYQVLTLFLTGFNCISTWLPYISTLGFIISIFSYALTFVVCLVSRSSTIFEQPWPKSGDIFLRFENNTGWEHRGMAFLVGLINPMWSFVGIDSATHMVDEVGHAAARVLVPRVIIATILIGFFTSFTYSIALFYCVRDTSAVLNSYAPALTIYVQATGNKNLAIFMQVCTIATGLTCGVASGTWQSRVLWALSRDMEKLKSREATLSFITSKFATIDSRCRVPLYSHLFSQVLVAITGCIMLGSTKAFNAIISAAVTLLIVSYAIPSLILLIKGRRRFLLQTGMKGLGWHAFGFVPHMLTVVYALFCLVILSFPYVKPVTAANMNYVSVVYAGIVLIIVAVLLLFNSPA